MKTLFLKTINVHFHVTVTKETHEKIVKEIRRKTRRNFSPKEKIRIVIEGLRGDDSIATIC